MSSTDQTQLAVEVTKADEKLNRAQRKYQKRKLKQHEKKLLKRNEGDNNVKSLDLPIKESKKDDESLMIEYVETNPIDELDENDPNYAEYADMFRRFARISQGLRPEEDEKVEEEESPNDALESEPNASSEPSQAVPDTTKKLSKRQKRLAKRMDIADLKGAVKRPDLVEIHDTTAQDPFLLVHLKTYRNTIPVPKHWSQKRKYLQGKRGIEKIPFQLPDFIRNTGITDLRQAALDRAEQQKLKAKQRERLRPKMGQLAVDYQVLHDAFFRYQTKPQLTRHGELYYEGKEFEPKTKDFVAGFLSEKLRNALGMPEGAPPPWLVHMQQHGPPPSYPKLRVPGVNAPIPAGAQYGFHPGGWGRAPIDMTGRPIWGWADAQVEEEIVSPNDYDPNFTWGALQYAEDYEFEEEEEEEEQAQPAHERMDVDQKIPAKPSLAMEGEQIELRKFQRPEDIILQPKDLYQVLPQQAASVGSAAMGSAYTYAIPPKKKVIDFLGTGQKTGELEISLDPSDFELSEEQLRAKYERLFREHERQQLQPQQQLSEADKIEFQRRVAQQNKEKKETKDKKKDYVKF